MKGKRAQEEEPKGRKDGREKRVDEKGEGKERNAEKERGKKKERKRRKSRKK